MPRIDKLLDIIGQSKYLTTLDLAKDTVLTSTNGRGRQSKNESVGTTAIYNYAIWTEWSTSYF